MTRCDLPVSRCALTAVQLCRPCTVGRGLRMCDCARLCAVEVPAVEPDYARMVEQSVGGVDANAVRHNAATHAQQTHVERVDH